MKKSLALLVGLSAIDTVASRSPPREQNQNLLANGNFQQNICKQEWCIYNAHTPNAVTGWNFNPEIQVGFGDVYNRRLGRNRVVELAPNFNTCIMQQVQNVRPGFYRLQVQYAARQGRTLNDSQFSIEFNGRVVRNIHPTDYQVRTIVIDLQVPFSCTSLVRLCGTGAASNNSFGAAINEVKLTRAPELECIPPPRRLQSEDSDQVLNPAFGSQVNQLGNLGN